MWDSCPSNENPFDQNFVAVERNLSGSIKNIFICVSKMNESIMSLEQHEGE